MKNARFLVLKDDSFGVNPGSAIRTWGLPEDSRVIGGYHILVWPNAVTISGGTLTPH
jgi:hypothetical protein